MFINPPCGILSSCPRSSFSTVPSKCGALAEGSHVRNVTQLLVRSQPTQANILVSDCLAEKFLSTTPSGPRCGIEVFGERERADPLALKHLDRGGSPEPEYVTVSHELRQLARRFAKLIPRRVHQSGTGRLPTSLGPRSSAPLAGSCRNREHYQDDAYAKAIDEPASIACISVDPRRCDRPSS